MRIRERLASYKKYDALNGLGNLEPVNLFLFILTGFRSEQ
jgi:hypothetical protein